ncbi:MAG: transcriptional regulator, GntR family [Frankiales bacterium]|jgi:DNA-binding GntR family transcriptional regulator|nr:transcriptional regulator, GntR family [Frankiales bacterium]
MTLDGASMTEPAAQRAYTATKDLILSGAIPAGTLLSEGAIADRLALSRTPVREAFLRLETEQLLQLIPKRGAIVIPVPPTEAADVIDVRLALETASVRRLAAPDCELTGLLAELGGLIGQQREFAAVRDVARFAEVDARFHRTIVNAAGNAIADRFYLALDDRQRRMTIGSVGPRPERLNALVTDHRNLMERVRDRDVEGFERMLTQHLHTTHRLFAPGDSSIR